jgi:hypothetical protein
VVCFLVSFDRSEVPTHTDGVGSFAFKISILCQIFRFSCLGVVSLPCECSWAIKLSAATVVARTGSPRRQSCKCCFGGIILKVETVPVRGSLQPWR